ncbi:hypothetical protein GG344DRAFT_82943 [Lentinula edodes]|nr:hypothetical protein GG344DRAFT_82943 [Lentinula edodes]
MADLSLSVTQLQPRATCEVGTQVEDPALALESFSRPSSSASGAGYGAGSEVEEDLDGVSAHSLSRDSAHNPTCDPSCDSARKPIYDSAHASDPDSIHDRNSIQDCDRNSIHNCDRNRNSIQDRNCNSIQDRNRYSIHNHAHRTPSRNSALDPSRDYAHGTPSRDPAHGSIHAAAHCSAQDPGRDPAHGSAQDYSQETACDAAHGCRGHISAPNRSHNSNRESASELAHHPRNSSQASVYGSAHAQYHCGSRNTAQDPTLKINKAFHDDQGEVEEGLLLANTIYSAPSKVDDESLLDHNTLLADSHQPDADDPNPLLDELLDELFNDYNHNNYYKEKKILGSDLDAAILSLLEDECSRPLVNSPTRQTGSSTSHFATSNEDPGSRKRRHLRDSFGEEVPVEVVRPRVAQANPFDPRPDCNRNRASASRKRPRVNHLLNLDFGEEEQQLGGEEENMGPQFLYEASDRPHAPPKEVTLLLTPSQSLIPLLALAIPDKGFYLQVTLYCTFSSSIIEPTGLYTVHS